MYKWLAGTLFSGHYFLHKLVYLHKHAQTGLFTQAVAQRCSVNKMFLEVSQNWQENTCARVRPAILLKKRPWQRCFPVNFAKFLRTPFLTEHLRWLLLYLTFFSLQLADTIKNVEVILAARENKRLSKVF